MKGRVRVPDLAVYLVAACALGCVVGPGVFSPPCPAHGDTGYYVDLARRHSLCDPRLFAHGQWPGGYPALLRVATLHLGTHPILFGRALSLLAAMTGLVSCMALAARCGAKAARLATGLALLANPLFLSTAATEATDMPAAGLICLGIALLGAGSPPAGPSALRAVVAGMALGSAYMLRYPALVAMPVAIGAAASSGSRLKAVGGVVAGFALAASPQLVSSALLRGNPFYNEVARNAWLAMHDGKDCNPRVWAASSGHVSLVQVVREDVGGFLVHWVREAGGYLWSGTGWPRGAGAIVLAAIVIVSLNRSIPLWRRFLVVGLPVCATGTTALAFFTPRHGIVSTTGFAVVLGVAAGTAWPRLVSRTMRPGVRIALTISTIVIVASALAWSLHTFRTRPTMSFVREIHQTMLDLGVTDVRQVLTNQHALRDTDSRWLLPYQGLQGRSSAQSAQELLTFAPHPKEVRFVVLDHHSYWGDFSGVRREVEAGGSALAPIYRDCNDSLEVYMVRPTELGQAEEDGVAFAPGLVLAGHTWVWRDGRLVVYLYWRRGGQLSDRFTVSVRLLDEGGREVASHAGEPELGTYPTTRWEENQLVVDAHVLEVGPGVTRGEVEVCAVREADLWRACRRLWPVRRGARSPLP